MTYHRRTRLRFFRASIPVRRPTTASTAIVEEPKTRPGIKKLALAVATAITTAITTILLMWWNKPPQLIQSPASTPSALIPTSAVASVPLIVSIAIPPATLPPQAATISGVRHAPIFVDKSVDRPGYGPAPVVTVTVNPVMSTNVQQTQSVGSPPTSISPPPDPSSGL